MFGMFKKRRKADEDDSGVLEYGTSVVTNPAFLTSAQSYIGPDLGNPRDVIQGIVIGNVDDDSGVMQYGTAIATNPAMLPSAQAFIPHDLGDASEYGIFGVGYAGEETDAAKLIAAVRSGNRKEVAETFKRMQRKFRKERASRKRDRSDGVGALDTEYGNRLLTSIKESDPDAVVSTLRELHNKFHSETGDDDGADGLIALGNIYR